MTTIEAIQNGLADAIARAYASSGVPQYDIADNLGGMSDKDMLQYYASTGRIAVYSGASERTIFGSAQVNYMFRAWHDYCHIRSGVCNLEHGKLGCFEPIAEYMVADYQCKGLGDRLARLVQIEVSEQARYFASTGQFVNNQIEFTVGKLWAE